ncbi:MAG: DUF305 domain-containing protein [Phenylobacterium sp.]|uniref:DUF305 domain-containing protein n=1 Tax=Phenylobacterium sp. TaxID=1871053 RepID=UPI002723C4DF|nr:DUF305 domain-containing protein [Phenylobacterium sp.]MDO8912604.1 DUF305 domain-containing protein [Phenylobacterium sp.]MDP3101661.1 DUF305 domain-containing protein [Phenylobacterium sp.]
MQKSLGVLAAISVFAIAPASALAHPQGEMDHAKMKGMDHSRMDGMNKGTKGVSSHMDKAMDGFMTSMKTMDHAMMNAKGATIDSTYARKMIAHHQGAIDMAKVELMHGSDPSAKRLAQMTIDENTKGIADLREYLRQKEG